MMYPTDDEAKKLIAAVCRRMYEKNYVVSNDGNVSVKVGDNAFWTTPTGVCKGDIIEDMLVKVDADGNILSGSLKPSSELKMHLRLYRENEKIGAVVHAHPPVATAFACAGMALEAPILAEAVLKLGTVPLAPYADLGTQKVADVAAPYANDYHALLLANHGAVTWSEDVWQCYYLLESVEQYAKILLYTKILGSRKELSSAEIAFLRK